MSGDATLLVAMLAAFAWLALSLLSTASTFLYLHRVRHPLPPAPARPGIVLLVAIKGVTPDTEAFLDALAAQRDVRHRLVFAVAAEDDPVCPVLDRFIARCPVPAQRVVAGIAAGRGQKVHNLLAALDTLLPEDEILAFTDADTLPPADWLAQLVRPLALGRADVSNGYIWTIPRDDRLGSRLAALLAVAVATTPRFHRWNLCSGAAMALTRTAAERIGLSLVWRNTISDDLSLSLAARQAGLHVHPTHRVLAPSPVSHDLGSLTAYARRQYLILRLYAPRYWLTALGAALPPVLLAALSLPLLQLGVAAFLAVPVLALLLQQLRHNLRLRIAALLLPAPEAVRSRAALRRDRWLVPVLPLVNLALILSTVAGRRIAWAGIRYHVHGAERVEVITAAENRLRPSSAGFARGLVGAPGRVGQQVAP